MLVWQAHKGRIESAAFSPDGTLLATTTGGTRVVRLWESNTGRLVRRLEGTSGSVQSVAFAPNAALFAAGTSEGIGVWDTISWSRIAVLALHTARELAFGSGSSPILIASNSPHTLLWEDTGRPSDSGANPRPHRHEFPRMGSAQAIHISPNETTVATSSTRETNLWAVATTAHVRTLRNEQSSHRGAVRFSPDGRRIAFAHSKWLLVSDVEHAGPGPSWRVAAGTGRSPLVWAVNWSADGSSILTAGNDGTVRLWDSNTGAELKSFEWGIGKLYCAAFSPDGLTCAAGGENGQVVIWDVDT